MTGWHEPCIKIPYVHFQQQVRRVGSVQYVLDVLADHDDTGDDEYINISM